MTSTRLFSLLVLTAAILVLSGQSPLRANLIIPDGNTSTSLATDGAVTDVTTSTVSGYTAFNSFKYFDVSAGRTVNLQVPYGTHYLMNLVHNKQTRINGVLNAVKNGRIGGQIFFLNPYGIAVGAGGSVNVGSLTALTPTREFMRDFFVAPGVPSATAVARVRNGDVPLREFSRISVKGQITAQGRIQLAAGDVDVSGLVVAGVSSRSPLSALAGLVNVDDIQAGAELVVGNGTVRINAADDAQVTGRILAGGSPGNDAGDVEIFAGDQIVIQGDAVVSAAGRGWMSDGGQIHIFAGDDALLAGRARLDARGDGWYARGGSIEFSAVDEVDITGGEMLAGSVSGNPGEVLVDPAVLNLDADLFSYGADMTFVADERINVNGVTISSRQIFQDDHVNGVSSGDSGRMKFSAPEIMFHPGSQILAHADNGFEGGDIFAQADFRSDTLPEAPVSVKIHVLDSLLKGEHIDLIAAGILDDDVTPATDSDTVLVVETLVGEGSRLISDDYLQMVSWALLNREYTQSSLSGALELKATVSAETTVEENTLLSSQWGMEIRSWASNNFMGHFDDALSDPSPEVIAVFSEMNSRARTRIEPEAQFDFTNLQMEVASEARTEVDLRVTHFQTPADQASGVFAVSDIDSSAVTSIGADIEAEVIVAESSSKTESHVEAVTSPAPSVASAPGRASIGDGPVAVTAAVSRHKNRARTAFTDDAVIHTDYMALVSAAWGDSTLMAVPAPDDGSGRSLALRQAGFDYHAAVDQEGAGEVLVKEVLQTDVYESALEPINELSQLSRFFLYKNLGYQSFYSRLPGLLPGGHPVSILTRRWSSDETSDSSQFSDSSESRTSTARVRFFSTSDETRNETSDKSADAQATESAMSYSTSEASSTSFYDARSSSTP